MIILKVKRKWSEKKGGLWSWIHSHADLYEGKAQRFKKKKVPKRWVVLDQGFIYMGMQVKDSENVSQKMGGPWSLLV